MFSLPNNNKIDEDGIIKGLTKTNSAHVYYLDIVTGQVGILENKNNIFFDKKRYFKIPKLSQKTQLQWIKKFIKEVVGTETKRTANAFAKSLVNKGIDGFFEKLETTDWVHGWSQWEHDHIYEEIIDWLETLPIEIKEDWELNDDCELCQLIMKDEHIVEDFKKAAIKKINGENNR